MDILEAKREKTRSRNICTNSSQACHGRAILQQQESSEHLAKKQEEQQQEEISDTECEPVAIRVGRGRGGGRGGGEQRLERGKEGRDDV